MIKLQKHLKTAGYFQKKLLAKIRKEVFLIMITSTIAERLIYRKAIPEDDPRIIADLMYQSNIPLYSYWFEKKDNVIEYFESRFYDPSFPFGFTNCFVAYEDTDEHGDLSDSILGVVIGWHSGMDTPDDFYDDEPISFSSRLTLESRIQPILYEATTVNDLLTIFGISVTPDYRNQGIGSKLLESYLQHIKKECHHIQEARLTYPEENTGAHRFFAQNNFECYSHSNAINTDGTTNHQISVALCRRQI